MVAMPDGTVYLNPTGNPGLASAGTGDVLAGFIAGLMAQGYDPDEAAYTANYLHGYTGDYLLEKESKHTIMATDLITNLGAAINRFEKHEPHSH